MRICRNVCAVSVVCGLFFSVGMANEFLFEDNLINFMNLYQQSPSQTAASGLSVGSIKAHNAVPTCGNIVANDNRQYCSYIRNCNSYIRCIENVSDENYVVAYTSDGYGPFSDPYAPLRNGGKFECTKDGGYPWSPIICAWVLPNKNT